ncbi:AtuA-related protein [Aliihoeflea aestuarii]|jgi:hypothetical protein|uniref:AtuA-related protein n=1 Tax=Aliihoeflea aestuarii TaxID=453840 RepID=UPI0020935F88|nr:hypothetical protein [Aliihoeflea aestuarii]
MPSSTRATCLPAMRPGTQGMVPYEAFARHPDLLPYIAREVTEERMTNHMSHLVQGKVTRFDVAGVNAFNFVMERALDGGGIASLRSYPLGKSMAQIALSLTVRIPVHLRELVGK